MQPSSAITQPTADFGFAKFNEYHGLISKVSNGELRIHKGACIFFTGLISHQANGICGDLSDLEEKVQIISEKNIRFCIFCPSDTPLKLSGIMGMIQCEIFWTPYSIKSNVLNQGHEIKTIDADNFIEWNNFCTKSNKSFTAYRLNFFQQLIISKVPITHWIYKINGIIQAALSSIVLGDTLMILNTFVENPESYKSLSQEAINREHAKGLRHVISYLTPKELKLPDSLSISRYQLYLKT